MKKPLNLAVFFLRAVFLGLISTDALTVSAQGGYQVVRQVAVAAATAMFCGLNVAVSGHSNDIDSQA